MSRRLLFLLTALTGVALGLVAANRPPAPLPPGTEADRVVVDKSDRTLTLLRDGTVLATYPVSLGAAPVGHKQREGDERTPEGTYVLDWRNAESIAHRSIHVAYPDAADTTRADSAGVSPGGQIMIHGITNGLGWLGRLHRLADWTDGCIGVTNAEMDQIWDAVADGTPIEIRP